MTAVLVVLAFVAYMAVATPPACTIRALPAFPQVSYLWEKAERIKAASRAAVEIISAAWEANHCWPADEEADG